MNFVILLFILASCTLYSAVNYLTRKKNSWFTTKNNIFYNPELIVLGGGLIEAIDIFYERTIEKAKTKALPIPAQKTSFKRAQLGDFSGVIGACFLKDLHKNKTLENNSSVLK